MWVLKPLLWITSGSRSAMKRSQFQDVSRKPRSRQRQPANHGRFGDLPAALPRRNRPAVRTRSGKGKTLTSIPSARAAAGKSPSLPVISSRVQSGRAWRTAHEIEQARSAPPMSQWGSDKEFSSANRLHFDPGSASSPQANRCALIPRRLADARLARDDKGPHGLRPIISRLSDNALGSSRDSGGG